MKKVALLLVVVLAATVFGFAQECTSGTMAQYTVTGFQCSIQDQTYQDFMYSSSSNPPGFSVPAGSVNVTPITTTGNYGFQWEAAGWAASNSSGVLSVDSLFQYAVSSTNPMTDLSLSIAGVGFSGTGSVSVDETACLGAMLPACSGGTTVTLRVFDSSSGQQLYDQVNFAGVNLIDVSKDLMVSAGTNGSAEVSVLTDQFSEGSGTVPEPSTLSMFGAGILALAGFARRKFNLF